MLRILCLLAAGCCFAQDRVLWRDPGAVERKDLRYPAGGMKNQPIPPFVFLSEESGGTSPKVLVRDRAGVEWRVKGGLEVKSESFATRFVSALGYFTEPTAFLARGRITGVSNLKRAAGFIQPDGTFVNAAFERRDPRLTYTRDDWSWKSNPFLGTKELKGLKVLVMLLSNWDNKDIRNRRMGSNTGILARRANGRAEWIYFVNDWGQTLGAWGAELTPKGWNCEAFTAQTPAFVQAGAGTLHFGFVGQHYDDFKKDIGPADVRWLMQYLGRITDAQIRSGLLASGATPQEAGCFRRALRGRIEQLRKLGR